MLGARSYLSRLSQCSVQHTPLDQEAGTPHLEARSALPLNSVRRRRQRTDEERVRDLVGHVSLAKEEILKSPLWKELQRRMQQVEEDALEASPGSTGAPWSRYRGVIVIGLGSPEGAHASRHQLALALLLAEGFEDGANEAPVTVRVRDPVLSKVDRALLAELGCQVLDTDGQAFCEAAHPTLYYLPHCPAAFTHNVLASNWSAAALGRIAVLGNSLETFVERWHGLDAAARRERPEPAAILQLVAARGVTDAPVAECSFPVRGAFNDTAVAMFPDVGYAFTAHPVDMLDLSDPKTDC